MDIRCVVCGEPWDAYGVTHGDMFPWEAKLFKAGAGCPSCEGVPNGFAPSTLSDVENGDEDPMIRIVQAERVAEGLAPKWERPVDPVHWACDLCGIEVVTDLDSGELEYRAPWKSKARDWHVSHNPRNGCPEEEPAHVFGRETRACEFCLDSCTDCGAKISSQIEGDAYCEGVSFPQPGNYHDCVCIDCLEKYCSDCENRYEECSCESEEEHDDCEESCHCET